MPTASELFNQHLYEEAAHKKKIIPEVGFNLIEDQYPEIKEQITRRGWRRLASPRHKIAKAMIQENGKLGFPSTIYKLCKDAKVRMRKFNNLDMIPEGRYITAEIMETVRVQGAVQLNQPRDEGEDQEMPQHIPENEANFGDFQHEQQHHHFEQPPQYEQPPQ
ncbi:hypothetical protein PIB30_089894 [Stylosanthes scabra]|uniref:Uncharacterized protein n=1 Tax=Stylosanthes scabra TaxID=79078 RepID=A0ABU6VT99_9FABA|nr:hypothetical protein [Stylosanthes scabra]